MPLSTTPEPVPFVIDKHGTARVGGTRLTLDTVVIEYKKGAAPGGHCPRIPSHYARRGLLSNSILSALEDGSGRIS